MADESCELGLSEQKKTLEILHGSQRNINENYYRLQKDQGGKKILKKHIENARFFKVLEETESLRYRLSKRNASNACKARQSS